MTQNDARFDAVKIRVSKWFWVYLLQNMIIFTEEKVYFYLERIFYRHFNNVLQYLMKYQLFLAYTLKCGRSRLFSLWYRYYTLYRSIHRVFSVLYSKQVFVRMSYVTFYRNHRGFTLKGKLFVHNGRSKLP